MEEFISNYFFIFFITLWVFVSFLISFLGGWFWLARSFPLVELPENLLDSFTWKSINLNYLAGYRSCVNIRITETGLVLKTSLIFRLFHNPMFLPWSDMEDLEFKKILFFESVRFYVGNTRIVIYGRVANVINKVYQRTKLNS